MDDDRSSRDVGRIGGIHYKGDINSSNVQAYSNIIYLHGGARPFHPRGKKQRGAGAVCLGLVGEIVPAPCLEWRQGAGLFRWGKVLRAITPVGLSSRCVGLGLRVAFA